MRRPLACLLVFALVGGARADRWWVGPSEVTGLAVTPNGRTILVAGMDGRIRLLDLARRRERANVLAHKGGVWALGLSGDGRHFITGGADHVARVWELVRVKEVQTYEGHTKPVSAVALSSDGRLAASGDYSGAVHLWEAASGRERFRQAINKDQVTGLAFSQSNKLLGAGGVEKAVIQGVGGLTKPSRLCLWQVADGTREVLAETGETVHFIPGRGGLAASGKTLDVVIDARGAMSIYSGAQTIVWDPWRKRRSFAVMNNDRGMAISPDGRYVATLGGAHDFSERNSPRASLEQGIHLWERASGKEVWARPVKEEDAGVMVVTPDGRTLIAGRRRGTLAYHDLRPEGWNPPARWSELHFARAWQTLGGSHAAEAYAAIWDLTARGDAAVRWLRKSWKPVSQEARVRRLVKELDADDFAVRQKARVELEQLAEEAEPILRASLEKPASAELKRSVKRLLAGLGPASPARLRQLRVLTVLERIGTRQARQMLQELSKGSGGAFLAEQARLAETRLAARGTRE